MGKADPGAALGLGFAYSGQMAIRPGRAGLSAARDRVRRVAADVGIPGDAAADLLLAVGEALSNAYRHGTPDPQANLIYLGWRFAEEVVTITVRDEGQGFTPREAAARKARSATSHGHGLHLMRQGVDEVYFEFDGGARVTLRRRVSGVSSAFRARDASLRSA